MSISTLVGFRVIDRNVPEIVIRKGSVGYLNYRRVPSLAMRELQNIDLKKRGLMVAGRPNRTSAATRSSMPQSNRDQVDPLIYTAGNDIYL